MEFIFSDADRAFRQSVRDFFRSELPEDLARRQRQGYYLLEEDIRRWQAILYAKGWAAPHWPVKFGGTGWTPTQRYIFEDETGAFDAPDPAVVGINLVGPVIYSFGSAEMQKRFLEPILRADVLCCQGFSEPNAGSDLASVRTQAIRDGDAFVITGQKIWTSEAQFSDTMICLARTNTQVKAQAGLSMFMLDMHAPGVRVVPIRTINDDHVVNEVFLDEVRVPARDLVGELDKGWSYTKFLLSNERTYNAHVNRLKRDVELIREHAETPGPDGRKLIDPDFRGRLAQLSIDVIALDWSVLRAFHCEHDMSAVAVAAASSLKIRGSELQLRASELEIEALGLDALPRYRNPSIEPYRNDMPAAAPDHAPGVVSRYLYRRASTIFGGTNDIQRTLIWNGALARR